MAPLIGGAVVGATFGTASFVGRVGIGFGKTCGVTSFVGGVGFGATFGVPSFGGGVGFGAGSVVALLASSSLLITLLVIFHCPGMDGPSARSGTFRTRHNEAWDA